MQVKSLSLVIIVGLLWILYWSLYNTQTISPPAHAQNSRMQLLNDSSSWSINQNKEFVSTVLRSRVKPKGKSPGGYILNLRFGHALWTDGQPLLSGPTLFQPDRKTEEEVQEFLAREHLTETPFDTDGLSPYLTSTREVIAEAQRVHLNVFRDLFRGKKYAILLQLPGHENKGDSAIGVGEMMLLARMGIELLLCMDTSQTRVKDYLQALTVVRRYPVREVAILMTGGGNIFGYPQMDRWREAALRYFRLYTVILLPQSVYMRGGKSHLQFARQLYRCKDCDLTIVLRDRLSLRIARRLFGGVGGPTRLLLAPDMAFHVGALDRHSPPFYDVSWLRRVDSERPEYPVDAKPEHSLPADVSLWTWDWVHSPSPAASTLPMRMVNVMESGLSFLQRGRVVVTDRLHGHILCTLLDIPHVLLDNADNKLSAYHNTWTRGLTNCRLASSVPEAATFALELLQEFKDVLPPRITAADGALQPPPPSAHHHLNASRP